MKKYFVVTVMVLMLLLLAACGSGYQNGSENDLPNSGESQYETDDDSPDPGESQNGIEDDPADSLGFDWKAEPTLEYENIYFCWDCGFSADGKMIDENTGEITGNYMGHGGSSYTLLYDEALRLFGAFSTFEGEHDLQLLAKDEFLSALWLPFDSELIDTLNLIYGIDSTKIITTHEDEWGPFFDLSKAYTGNAALAVGLDFVTGFEFDGGEWHPLSIYYILDPITQYVTEVGSHKRSYNVVAVQQDDKWGIVDRHGNTVIPFVFEHAITIDNDTAFAKYNERYGILRISE